MRAYFKHLSISSKIRKLIQRTAIAEQLYWYDQPLKKVLGLRGIMKFIGFALSSRNSDDIAGNYHVNRLYNGPAINNGLSASGATVWNYTRIKNPPVIEGDEICQVLENNAAQIIKEYKDNIDKIVAHPDNNSLARDGTWSGIFLYGVDSKKDPLYEDFFKITYKVLDQLPLSKNFGFALISRLSPGVRILPHCGSSNLRFRYHLGLDVPEPDMVKIRVGKVWKHWKEGKAYGFDDSFEHEVIHDGKKDRVVLIVDVWNPALTNEEITIFDNKLFHQFGNK